ncbi:hypothetical protein ACP8YR_22670, partial [Escherichia coli]
MSADISPLLVHTPAAARPLWLRLYANTNIFTFGTFFVQLLTITTAGYVFACHDFRGKQTQFLLFLVQLM